jgi:hypothetical protein
LLSGSERVCGGTWLFTPQREDERGKKGETCGNERGGWVNHPDTSDKKADTNYGGDLLDGSGGLNIQFISGASVGMQAAALFSGRIFQNNYIVKN